MIVGLSEPSQEQRMLCSYLDIKNAFKLRWCHCLAFKVILYLVLWNVECGCHSNRNIVLSPEDIMLYLLIKVC